MFRKTILLLVAVVSTNILFAQKFIYPLDLRPPYLSANFGELRPNHFHSGVDFKTERVEGKVVRAIDSGYIARVQILPSGYGRVLYLNHSNGYTSVYAHLQKIDSRVDSAVIAYQYEKKVQTVDISFMPDQFPVAKGQQIAVSGNSGSSGGPHLHFEIRKTDNQHTLNPMLFYEFQDNVAPKILGVGVYPMDSNSFVAHKQTKKLFYSKEGLSAVLPEISVYGNIGFSVFGYDYMPGQSNIYGFYKTELECNGEILYSRIIDEIDFATSSDINSLIDYEERLVSKRNYERMWVEQNNDLKIYTNLRNQGIYQTTDSENAQCVIKVADFHGNKSTVCLNLKQGLVDSLDTKTMKTEEMHSCADTFSFAQDGFEFRAKPKTFFSDFSFSLNIDTANTKGRYHSSQYQIKTNQIMFKNAAEIVIPYSLPDSLAGKGIIENCGKKTPILTKFDENGFAHANIKSPGKYAVVVDTVAPKIKISQEKLNDMTNHQYILFKMSDNYSGVAKYNAYIDGQWQILYYDAKTGAVFLHFDRAQMEFGKKHTLRIVLEDLCHNVLDNEYVFYK